MEEVESFENHREESRVYIETLRNEELLNNSELVNNVAETYTEIFNAKGDFEWGEDWKKSEVIELLEHSMSQPDSINLLNVMIDKERENPVVGFSIGHIGPSAKAFTKELLPKDIPTNERGTVWDGLQKRLDARTQGKNILYTQELGIIKTYRSGSSRVASVVRPLFEHAIDTGVEINTFWTSKKSKMYFLSRIIDSEVIYPFQDEQKNIFMASDAVKTLGILDLNEDEINHLLRNNYEWRTNK